MGEYAKQKLLQLKQKHSIIDSVRGTGLMIGVQLTAPGGEIVDKCLANGLRINCTNNTVLRFMPAMIVTKEQIDKAIDILDSAIGETK
jgi:4-aminobutyrate aminotransferase-like enzyme